MLDVVMMVLDLVGFALIAGLVLSGMLMALVHIAYSARRKEVPARIKSWKFVLLSTVVLGVCSIGLLMALLVNIDFR